jgi:hypothetical protein
MSYECIHAGLWVVLTVLDTMVPTPVYVPQRLRQALSVLRIDTV